MKKNNLRISGGFFLGIMLRGLLVMIKISFVRRYFLVEALSLI